MVYKVIWYANLMLYTCTLPRIAQKVLPNVLFIAQEALAKNSNFYAFEFTTLFFPTVSFGKTGYRPTANRYIDHLPIAL